MPKIFSFEEIEDYSRADRLTNKKAKLSYENDNQFKSQCFEFLKKEENIQKYLPEFSGMPARKIYTKLRFERLFGGVYMYKAEENVLMEVTRDF